MATRLGKTIDIVTTDGRYTALRANDPVWSGFLPDADIVAKDKEYVVSKSVSRAIDSQWDAYNRFLEYLDGIAFVEFSTPVTRFDSLPNVSNIVCTENELIINNRIRTPITDRRIVTRRDALARREGYLGEILNRTDLGVAAIVQSGSTTEVKCGLSRLYETDTVSDSGENVSYVHWAIITYNDPSEMVYLDEIDRIAYILNLPEGFEMWVPVRDLPTSPLSAAQQRSMRIEHTTRAGRAEYVTGNPLLSPDGSAGKEYEDVTMQSLFWPAIKGVQMQAVMNRVLPDKMDVSTMPKYYLYIYGAIRLASLTAYQSPPDGGVYDIGGIVWSDVIPAFEMYSDGVVESGVSGRVSLGHIEPAKCSPEMCYRLRMSDGLRFMAENLVSADMGGQPGRESHYEYKNSLPKARLTVADRMALLLPSDVDLAEVGLEGVVTGHFKPKARNVLQHHVNLTIKRFYDAQNPTNRNRKRVREEMGIEDDTTLGEVLVDETTPAIANLLLLSLLNWLATHPSHKNRQKAAQLAEELDAELSAIPPDAYE